MENRLSVTCKVSADPAKVFKAWTTPSFIKQWHCGNVSNAIMELRIGGEFRLDFEADENCDVTYVSGKVQEVVTNQRVVYGWKWDSRMGIHRHSGI